MKRILLVVGIFIIGIAVALFFVFRSSTPNSETPSQTQTGLPVAGSVNQGSTPVTAGGSLGGQVILPAISIGTYGGTAIVQDFMHNGESWADIQNPGSYILAGSAGYCLADGTCPHGASTDEFNISYNSASSFFNIVLLKEPLGATRVATEQFLGDRLGLSEQDMCVLNYFVGTPYYVSENFSGKNLGFSFCPGATTLPK